MMVMTVSIMYVIHLCLMNTLQHAIKSLNNVCNTSIFYDNFATYHQVTRLSTHPLLFPQTSVHLHRRWLQRLHLPGDSVGADDVIANRSTVNVQWPLQPFKHRPACTLEWLPAIWQPVGTSHPSQHCKDFRDGVWQWTVWARCLQCSVTRSIGNHSLSFFLCGCCNNYVCSVLCNRGIEWDEDVFDSHLCVQLDFPGFSWASNRTYS